MALKLKTKCHLDQTMCKTWSMTGHQRPLPSSTERQPEIPPIIRDIHLWGRVCAHRSARYCQQFHTPSGFPQSHVAMRVTLHSGRNSQLRYPPGTAPHPLHNPPPQQSCLVSSKKFLGLRGTTQPKITGHISTFICIPEQAQTLQQQLFDHSQAQIEFWKY